MKSFNNRTHSITQENNKVITRKRTGERRSKIINVKRFKTQKEATDYFNQKLEYVKSGGQE